MKLFRILFWAGLFVLGLMVPVSVKPALAATCSGANCTGLFASSTGCNATNSSDPNYIIRSNGKIERRYSSICETKWTRVTNVSGSSKYTAGSTRYGCSDYCAHQSIESGGWPPNSQPIANNSYVFTPQVWNAPSTK
jgi:hypothetical protein